jgi:hypothetical protein
MTPDFLLLFVNLIGITFHPLHLATVFGAYCRFSLLLFFYILVSKTFVDYRQNLVRFLPEHAARGGGGILSWLPWAPNSKSAPEARIIEQFKVTATLLRMRSKLTVMTTVGTRGQDH